MKTNFTNLWKSSLLMIMLCLGLTSWGQYSITGIGESNTYTQDFDTFAGTDVSIPTGWALSATPNGYYNMIGGTFSGNNLYALRENASSTDIAVGGKVAANSGNCSGTGTRTITFQITNNTGSDITGLVVTWNVEQYSQGQRATTLNLTHNFGGTTTGTTTFTATTGSPEGNLGSISTTARSITISELNFANGSSGTFTFTICTGSGSGNNSHVGIDDFTLYATGTPIYTVTYDGNGAVGDVPVDTTEYIEDDTVTVLGQGTLTMAGHNFTGWNTQVDGSGTYYAEEDTFLMPANDVTLYAQWVVSGTPFFSTTGVPVSGFDFSYTEADNTNASDFQSFNLSGENLTGVDVMIITDEEFEVSLSENSGYTDELTLAAFNGSETTIYVRMVSGLTAGNSPYSGILWISGGGVAEANEIEIDLSGIVIPAPVITNAGTENAIVGVPFSFEVEATDAMTFSSVDFPVAGLTLSPEGVVSGSPDTAGTFIVDITATGAGGTDTKAFTFIIAKGNQTVENLVNLTKYNTDSPFDLPENTSAGLVISYMSSDENVATISGNTVTIIANGMTTITATQVGNDNWNEFEQQITITVTEAPETYTGVGTFEKITSLDELEDGYYVVTNETDLFLMTNSNIGWFESDDANVDNVSGLIVDPSVNNVWKIETNGGGKTIYNEVIEKYVGWQSGNTASAEDIPADTNRWTFTYADNKFTVNNVATPIRQLSYNAVSPRFAAYGNANQQELQLYKLQVPSTEPILLVSETEITGLNYGFGSGPSDSQSFVLSGENLEPTTVSIEAPEGFIISFDDNNYEGELQLFTYSGAETTIYVKLAAGQGVGNYNGNIEISSGETAEIVLVAISGSVLAVPVITEDTFAGEVGVAFSEQIEATQSPTSYAVISGTLPDGLTLNTETGIISGTPEEAGGFEIEVTAENAVGTSTSAFISFTIGKGTQTVELADINVYFGAENIELPETTEQGFVITYESDDENVASVSGNTVTIVGVGTTVITAVQAGNDNWNEFEQQITVTVAEEPEVDHLVISQVYGGGGNTGAPYNRDYVELYNPTSFPISLNGYTLQYGSATGTVWGNNANNYLPNVAVQPGQYYLIQTTTSGTNGNPLPTPDHIYTTSMDLSGTNGKVALVSSTNTLSGPVGGVVTNSEYIVDLVGFGTANYYEGSGAAPAPSNTTSIFRKNNGNQDTDDNANDFETGTPNPRNSSFVAPVVTWTTDNEWINGMPSIDEDVIIEGVLFVGDDYPGFSAKSLTVAEDGAVNIASGSSVTVKEGITNNAGATGFIVEKGGNLVQIDNVANTGAITVEIEALTEWFGYNMFSSPVAGQTFAGFSGNNGGEVYTYTFIDDDNHYYDIAGGTTFEEGLGYLFAAPYDAVNFPVGELSPFSGSFAGVPHNGTVTVPVAENSFKALGNPYPSAISAEDLLSVNPNLHTLYFWTNANFYDSVAEDYTGNNYATFTSLTGTGTTGFPVSNELTIEAGQGFIASISGAGNVVFNNSMRLTESDGIFYKTMQDEKHILWLNLLSENHMLNQIAIGYAPGATEGFDTQIDGKMFGYAGSALYSIIANEDAAYAIQGRSLPFTDADVVALGFRAIQSGSYTISLADFNGLFADGQDIFVKDNLTQTEQNLKEGDYTFVSEDGVFNNRFGVVYKETGGMGVNNPSLDSKWLVYSQGNGFQIETQGFDMKEVVLYDMLGRMVYNNQADGTNHTISQIGANGVLIVKVITSDNQILTRKVVK